MTATAGTPAGGDAVALIRLLREAVAAAAPQEALHLRLGRFAPQLRQQHRRRLVEEALALLREANRVRMFTLPNADLVAVAPVGLERLREAEAALRTLFASEGGNQAAVAARHRLPDEAAALFAAVEAALAPAPAATPAPPHPSGGPRTDHRGAAGFGTECLSALERGLAGADLSAFLRQRPVCRLDPGDARGPAVAWSSWRVAAPEVFAALGLPGAGPGTSPWLLRRLRRALDRRFVAALARPERAAGLGAAALRLSPASVGTSEFARFAEALGRSGPAATVIGTRAEDVLADPAGFAEARDRCRAWGFRTALVEAEAAVLALLPPHRLGLDVLHLRWSPGLPAAFAAAAPLAAAGRDGVVLSGADTAAAIGWGWEQGIGLFEGRLMRPKGG
ncbi:MAG: hypothetical protein ICV73_06275 [Acetobacteraceae bacterium]|nr:hypothetical protein [Acetobacteraceae bacterium]